MVQNDVPHAEGQASNPFLGRLLELQQDGAGAIAVPQEFGQAPLLHATNTRLMRAAGLMEHHVVQPGATCRWHFLLGSPGNGKSAATNHLLKTLVDQGWTVPADLGTLKHAFTVSPPPQVDGLRPVVIINDASVLADPGAAGADNGKDFVDALHAAALAGRSLWACVNRGVLHRAQQLNDEQLHGLRPLLNSLADAAVTPGVANGMVGLDPGVPNVGAVFAQPIDAYSLLLSEDAEFDQIAGQAVCDANWAACARCSAKEVCPFKQNRELLKDETGLGRQRLKDLLIHAELMSGEPLVFRESQAILSLLLAGPRTQYAGHADPCAWVHARVNGKQWASLAMRRAPVALLAPQQQLARPRAVLLAAGGMAAHQAVLDCLDNDSGQCCPEADLPALTSDVGRVMGSHGVIARLLDPLLGIAPQELDDAASGFPAISAEDHLVVSQLETELENWWKHAAKDLTDAPEVDPAALALLLTWKSEFTLRYGAFIRGKWNYADQMRRAKKHLLKWADTPAAERLTVKKAICGLLAGDADELRVAKGAALRSFGPNDGDWKVLLDPQVSPTCHGDQSRFPQWEFSVRNGPGQPMAERIWVRIPLPGYCALMLAKETAQVELEMQSDDHEAARVALRRSASVYPYATELEAAMLPLKIFIQRPGAHGAQPPLVLVRYDLNEIDVKGEV